MWIPFNIGSLRLIKRFFETNEYLLSDYSLSSSLAWNSSNNQLLFQVRDGVLLLCIGNKYGEIRHLLLPLGLEKQPPDAEFLRNIAFSAKCPRFGSVPESSLAENILAVFNHHEDEQNANYIYLAETLATLKGNRFNAKRNHINGFMRSFPPSRLLVEPITASTAWECLECLERWQREKSEVIDINTEITLKEECAATTVALNTIDMLDWISLLVRIDGVVCAFAIGSRLTQHVVALNFEKALASYRGLYQFLDREFASLAAVNYRYINKESDMGIVNLRASKESYHPHDKIRSFSLVLK